ncbi:MAG: AMP-binding protein [Flavobacteriales bacterium]
MIPSNWHLLSNAPELQQQVQSFLLSWQQNLPFEFRSSGSTGQPQIFKFSKNQLLVSAQASVEALHLNAHTKALVCLPLSSVGGLMQLARAMVAGFELWIDTPAARPLRNFDTPINFISLVPTQLSESLTNESNKLKNIQQILIGGGPLTTELINTCLLQNIHLIQSYGMTETLSHVALRRIDRQDIPPFEALNGVHFEQQNHCLKIHYPDLQPEPIITNDIVHLIDSKHFDWLGRADFAIITGGAKVLPELIEQKLNPFIKQSFFIIGVKDDKWGEVVGLVFEGTPIELEIPWEHAGLLVAERPKKVLFIEQFIRSSTLKIQRQATLDASSHEVWKSI